ncbi:MAG: hypothetical protein IT477_10810 [Rhodanobacteraceae bacterium]|nr:hypothetical protein [Rhodanobacteraceae bacterium]
MFDLSIRAMAPLFPVAQEEWDYRPALQRVVTQFFYNNTLGPANLWRVLLEQDGIVSLLEACRRG